MALAFFDLDDTLLHGDSAGIWFEYLTEIGWVSTDMHRREQQMLAEYYQGTLSMQDYMNFTLSPLCGKPVAAVATLVDIVLQRNIVPNLYTEGLERLAWHRNRDDEIVLVSATGEHIVSQVAAHLGIRHVLAIQLVVEHGCYTGATQGVLSYQQGKVTRIQQWLAEHNQSLAGSYGYSDSINDLPMLGLVDQAFVVNPGKPLLAQAHQQGWPVFHWNQVL